MVDSGARLPGTLSTGLFMKSFKLPVLHSDGLYILIASLLILEA
jgi:hypothetical protein